jgi:hypothetical protein
VKSRRLRAGELELSPRAKGMFQSLVQKYLVLSETLRSSVALINDEGRVYRFRASGTSKFCTLRGAAHSSNNVKYYWTLTELWQECFACSSVENRAQSKKNCKSVAPHLLRSFIAEVEKVSVMEFDDGSG